MHRYFIKKSQIKHVRRPSWMDHDYVKARALKRKYEKRFKKTRDFNDKIDLIDQSKLCAELAEQKRTAYYKSAIQSREGDQRALFSFVCQLLDSSPIDNLPDGSEVVIANELNTFFVNKIEQIHDSIAKTSNIEFINNPTRESTNTGSTFSRESVNTGSTFSCESANTGSTFSCESFSL